MKKTIKIIEQEKVSSVGANGGYRFMSVFSIGSDMFRVVIKGDSYIFQTKAKLEKWTTEKGFCPIIERKLTEKENVSSVTIYETRALVQACKEFSIITKDFESKAQNIVKILK
jgi:hypothetical protein